MRHAILLFWLLPAAPQEKDAERLLKVVEARYTQAGDPTDVPAQAKRLGFERFKIADFVRKEIGFEPYAGALRDAGGTLLARSGNSLDRALLVQAMLAAAGDKTRIVRRSIDEAEQKRFVEWFLKGDPRARLKSPDPDLKALAEALGTDVGSLEKAQRERRQGETALVDDALKAARPEAERLRKLVGDREPAPLPVPSEHYWTQLWDNDRSAWIDFDPIPFEVARVDAEPLSDTDLAALRHTIEFKLVLNRTLDDKPDAVILLHVGYDVSAIAWKAVDLVVQPSEKQLSSAGKLRGLDEKKRIEALGKVKIWRPGLIVDGKAHGAAPFDLKGNTFAVDKGGNVGAVNEFGKGLEDAFGGLLDQPKKPVSKLVSVVLEVAVKEPGGEPRVHRREILGPTKPGALPILRTSFLVDTAPLPPGERQRRALGRLVRNLPEIRKVLEGKIDGVHVNLHAEPSALLLAFADLRRRGLAGLSEGGLFFQERAGIAAETRQAFIDGDKIRLRRGIDIMENPLGIVATGKRSVAATLTLGVADTVLECLLLTRSWRDEKGLSAWTLLEGGKADKVEEAGGLLEVRLKDKAWWSLEASTGVCVGRVPGGAGQGMVEYAWQVASKVCELSDFFELWSAMPEGTTGRDTAETLDNICDVVKGEWPREMVKDKINKMVKKMWDDATNALAGLP